MFWSSVNQDRIYRAYLNGTDWIELVNTDLVSVCKSYHVMPREIIYVFQSGRTSRLGQPPPPLHEQTIHPG